MKVKLPERQIIMFETPFSDVLNPEHELLSAANLIDWENLHNILSQYYSPMGRHGKPIRLMVGIHILKHRYNSSDERTVEMLHENAYWQYFCGFKTFQKGQILDATSLVKFRKRIGTQGMHQIEAVLLNAWSNMGLVKSKRVAVDTTCQPKNIAYPTDADLLHRVREKIVNQVKKIRKEITLRKPFRSYRRVGKEQLIRVKKFFRANSESKAESKKETVRRLKEMTSHVVEQAARIVNSLYSRGFKEAGRELNRLVSIGKRIVNQTEQVLSGVSPKKRLYSLHEQGVAAIKKGKSHPDCEFGSVVALAKNDDGIVLFHEEYQQSISDVKTLGRVIVGVKQQTGKLPELVTGDRGFAQSPEKQESCRKRWGVKRLAIPRKGRTPHPDSNERWFKEAIKNLSINRFYFPEGYYCCC
jgi:IS5 family transposase